MILLALLIPVVILVFLLAMERLERELLDTIPAAGYDHALLARRAGGSGTRGAERPPAPSDGHSAGRPVVRPRSGRRRRRVPAGR